MQATFKYLYIIVLTTIFSMGVSSCKKFIEIPAPSNQLLKSNLFTTDESATSALAGIYSEMMNASVFNGTLHILGGISADVLGREGIDEPYDQFWQNNIQVTNSNNLTVWTDCYKFIYYANSALEGLAIADQVSDSTRKRLTGEAKLIRALCLFYLGNLWGDVPLITNTNYQANAIAPRSNLTEVYQQVIADLKDAQNLLPVYYSSADKSHPNKHTAAAMLARAYLFTGDWSNAEIEAGSVIESNAYSLDSLNRVFLKGSTETIWQLMPVAANYVPLAFRLIPSNNSTIPNYPLTDKLISSFENGDQRKLNWTKSNTIAGATYHYTYKYKATSGSSVTECMVVFRLAEQYLIRAEARARQNKFTEAINDINVVRKRAALPDMPDLTDQSLILNAIEKERLVELFTEWSDRWLHLKRTDRVDAIIGPYKIPDWQSSDALWPIPQTQINANPNLTQNQGY